MTRSQQPGGDDGFTNKPSTNYSKAKSISSEQANNQDDEAETAERYQQFSNASSLGSDQFFGNDEPDSPSRDLAYKVSAIAAVEFHLNCCWCSWQKKPSVT